MIMASGAIASRLSAVSSNVSPFVTEEVEAEMLMESADNRFAAISNDVRVRVEDSKKKLITVLPRRVGTFLMTRVDTSLKDWAVSRMVLISSAESSLMPSRSLRLNATGLSLFGSDYDHLFFFVIVCEHHFDDFRICCLNIFAYVIGLYGQFAMATVDQDGKLYSAGPTEIYKLV